MLFKKEIIVKAKEDKAKTSTKGDLHGRLFRCISECSTLKVVVQVGIDRVQRQNSRQDIKSQLEEKTE